MVLFSDSGEREGEEVGERDGPLDGLTEGEGFILYYIYIFLFSNF